MRICFAVAVVCSSLITLHAAAQDGDGEDPAADDSADTGETRLGDDEVVLKNGGLLRGTLISVEPDKEVVIQVLGSDAPRRIPWSEIEKVNRGKYQANPKPVSKRKPKPPPAVPGYDEETQPEERPPSRDRPGVVRLHIESDEPGLTLREHLGTSMGYVPQGVLIVSHLRSVCVSPCDQTVDGSRGGRYFVEGDGVPSSSTFSLASYSGDVTLDVSAGSTGLRGGGIALISVGGAAMLAGALVTLFGHALTTTEYDDDFNESVSEVFPEGQVAGPVLIGAGGATLIGGIVMAVASRTTYELRPSSERAHDARSPVWWRGEF